MPRKTFTAGSILTSTDVNSFLMNQSVMVFADSAARTTGIPSPTEGMMTYLSNTNVLNIYDGAAWVGAVNAGSLNGFTGVIYADAGITMSTSYVQRTVTIPSSKQFTDIVSIIPYGGVNDYVGISEIYLGNWSGVLLPTQSIIGCRLGNAVASTTGFIRFYFRS
jgi:hypothetical protein